MSDDLLTPINCACFNIRRAARKITQSYDQALKPTGLQATQFTLLAMIAGRAGGRDQTITMMKLAAALGMDRTTLTRNLGLAERSGWVVIKAGEDRRERRIGLTPKGQRKFRAALPVWKCVQKRILKQLDEKGLNDLLKLVRRLESE